MKIQEYLKENKISQESFCKTIFDSTGIPLRQGSLSKYCLDKRTPKREIMQAIYKVTNKQVTPNDFFDLD
tara:strand:+ start:997 stop:1206 length:210 start_codon:yes stop_codon:yes gene_type:complete